MDFLFFLLGRSIFFSDRLNGSNKVFFANLYGPFWIPLLILRFLVFPLSSHIFTTSAADRELVKKENRLFWDSARL